MSNQIVPISVKSDDTLASICYKALSNVEHNLPDYCHLFFAPQWVTPEKGYSVAIKCVPSGKRKKITEVVVNLYDNTPEHEPLPIDGLEKCLQHYGGNRVVILDALKLGQEVAPLIMIPEMVSIVSGARKYFWQENGFRFEGDDIIFFLNSLGMVSIQYSIDKKGDLHLPGIQFGQSIQKEKILDFYEMAKEKSCLVKVLSEGEDCLFTLVERVGRRATDMQLTYLKSLTIKTMVPKFLWFFQPAIKEEKIHDMERFLKNQFAQDIHETHWRYVSYRTLKK
jgi:hypothetical protein